MWAAWLASAGEADRKDTAWCGRTISSQLANERMEPGSYERVFNGGVLASGVYFYRLTAGEIVQVRKLLLLR